MNKTELNFLKEQLGSDGKFIEIKPYYELFDGKDMVSLECLKRQKNFGFSLYWLGLYKDTFVIQDNLDSLAFNYIHKYFPSADKAVVWTNELTTEKYHIEYGHKQLHYLNGPKCGVYDFDCTYIIKVSKNFNVDKLHETEIDNAILYIIDIC